MDAGFGETRESKVHSVAPGSDYSLTPENTAACGPNPKP